MRLETEIEINAPAAVVWTELVDFAKYPEWNPFIKKIAGRASAGERLVVRIEAPGGFGATLRPKVLAATPGTELRWLGQLWIPGLFDGEHSFELEALGTNRTRFVQAENFRGLLVPLFAKSLNTSTRRGFESMNKALKTRAEAQTLNR